MNKTYKVHVDGLEGLGNVCNWFSNKNLHKTKDWKKVTCKVCLKLMRRRIKARGSLVLQNSPIA